MRGNAKLYRKTLNAINQQSKSTYIAAIDRLIANQLPIEYAESIINTLSGF